MIAPSSYPLASFANEPDAWRRRLYLIPEWQIRGTRFQNDPKVLPKMITTASAKRPPTIETITMSM